ncbi:MAG TPA: hypothetical protein VIC08_06520, partial [Cellvibrionaceae bacterium]
ATALTLSTMVQQVAMFDLSHAFNVEITSLTLEENVIKNNEGVGAQFNGEAIDQFRFINNTLADNQFSAVTEYSGNDLHWSGNRVTNNKNNAVPKSSGFKNSAIPTADFLFPTTIEVHKPVDFINSSVSNNIGGFI